MLPEPSFVRGGPRDEIRSTPPFLSILSPPPHPTPFGPTAADLVDLVEELRDRLSGGPSVYARARARAARARRPHARQGNVPRRQVLRANHHIR